jgi:hypothetical protein
VLLVHKISLKMETEVTLSDFVWSTVIQVGSNVSHRSGVGVICPV